MPKALSSHTRMSTTLFTNSSHSFCIAWKPSSQNNLHKSAVKNPNFIEKSHLLQSKDCPAVPHTDLLIFNFLKAVCEFSIHQAFSSQGMSPCSLFLLLVFSVIVSHLFYSRGLQKSGFHLNKTALCYYVVLPP